MGANPLRLIRRWGVADLGRMLYAYFAGPSYKNLVVLFPQFHRSSSTLCLWVHSLVGACYAAVDS